jgi:hypothetical protein
MLRKLASRSIYGCWTCRLRKKKCDENRPSCFKCTSLQLNCDGYGPRPYWMDRGDLQREQARKMKRIISQIKSDIREHKLLSTSQNVEPELDTLAARNIATSRLPPSDPTQETLLQSGLAPEHNLQLLSREGDLYTSSEPIWSEPLHSSNFSTEPFYDQTIGISIYNQRPSEASQRLSMSISPVIDERDSRNSIDVSRQNVQPEANMEAMVPLCDPTLSTFCSSVLSGYSNEADSSFLTQKNSSSGFAYHISQPARLSHPILCGDVEDILFMYYFDHVFYVHCPFYFPTNQRGRGWLFSILKRFKSAYHAALALSEYHQSTLTQHNSSHPIRTRGGHYDLALQELQVSLARSSTWSENLGLAHNIQVLTSILHLLFYEVRLLLPSIIFNANDFIKQLSNGGKHNWQMHLRAATALVPPLVQAQIASITARKDHINEQQDRVISHPDTSISFLLGFFISMDIISCASTRSSQLVTLDHKLMLEIGETNLANLTGCSNWAMVFIFEISLLDKWREEEKKAHKLSLIELTERGRQIEERLWRRLANIENEPSKRAPVNSHLRMLPDSIKTEITRIFALSAITYLHVVISGAYPEIPEIRKSVSKTIDALQSLPDPKLLRNVVWPFCISGCLAVDGQQNLFRELVSSLHITQSIVGTCLEAFEIMKECWQLRKTGSCSYDLACIMRKRGQYVLLG